jgi:hypothetical protein
VRTSLFESAFRRKAHFDVNKWCLGLVKQPAPRVFRVGSTLATAEAGWFVGRWTLDVGHRGDFCLTVTSRPQHTREMQIHIARNGQPTGPFSLEEVNRQLAAGTLSVSDQAWYEGAAGWAPLSMVPGVSSSSGPTGSASPQPPGATPPGVPAVTAPMVGGPVTAVVVVPSGQTEPLAIWSLVLSLLGVCGFCCTPVVITGIAGVVCGHLALSKIGTRPELQGRGLAMAGLIIGYCAIAGWLLWVLLFGGLAVMQGILHSISK